jgi:carbamoyltransferase
MKHYLGLSAGYHDAAATVINSNGDIVFAGHAERYSKQKNDPNICPGLMEEFCNYYIDEIAWYERPWNKQLRRIYSGEGIESKKLTVKQNVRQQLDSWLKHWPRVRSFNHHLSHAAAGFQTSPYDRATVVVIDAIGEWDTISIWSRVCQRQSHLQKIMAATIS